MAADQIAALIKFCDTETGLKILNSQSLRWSAPALFNDPFEPDHHSNPDFNKESLLQGLIKEALNMLFGPTEPSGRSNRLIAAIARWRDEERFGSEDEAQTVLKQLLSQISEQQYEGVGHYMSNWSKFATTLRICCFSDKATNMDAWQRFADNHNGLALKFACGQDTALPAPFRMTYGTTPPLITSLKEQVDVAYGRSTAPKPDKEFFLSKLLSKNRENNSEREWRCFNIETEASEDQSLWYSNKKFSTPELKAVYLGLTMPQQQKEAIVKLIKEKYKKTKIYQADIVSGKYEIDFSVIS